MNNIDLENNETTIYNQLINSIEKFSTPKKYICNANFKCDISQISETVIIAPTWEVEIFKKHVDNINKISGPTGHGFTLYELLKNNKKFTYITTGIGSCNLMDAILALGTTDCKNIIFIGANGTLDKNLRIGDIMIPEYSICGTGADRYLCTNNLKNNDCFGNKYYPDSDLFNKTISCCINQVEGTDVQVYKAQNFSIDTIFAEYVHLDEIINLGCNSIEMETATLFHTANITNIKAVAIFNISDNTLAAKSLYSGRTTDDTNRRHMVKNEIIPQIVLNLLEV